jgi:ribonuclease T2
VRSTTAGWGENLSPTRTSVKFDAPSPHPDRRADALRSTLPLQGRVRYCLASLAIIVAATLPSFAQDKPGDFDFYVLALSWSPTYCTLEDQPDEAQCGVADHGFILHGLWPQYETGYPEDCRGNLPVRLPNDLLHSITDLTPSPGLVGYQWRKHGICAGLRPDAYFRLAREAFEKIEIPDDFVDPAYDEIRAPIDIERAFLAANPGLKRDAVAITCKERHLSDVRICMTKDLQFRSCPEVDADYCRTRQIDVPAIQ